MFVTVSREGRVTGGKCQGSVKVMSKCQLYTLLYILLSFYFLEAVEGETNFTFQYIVKGESRPLRFHTLRKMQLG